METPEAMDQQIEKVKEYLQEGKSLRKTDLGSAIEAFSNAVELSVKLYGEKSPLCAPYYLEYGLALLDNHIDNVDCLGEKVKEAESVKVEAGQDSIDKCQELEHEEENEPEGEEHTEIELPNSGETDKPEGEKEESDSGDDDTDTAEDIDDLQRAWEHLELARLLFTEDGEENHLAELADVYCALADISAESEDFSNAVKESQNSLNMLMKMSNPKKRKIAEVNYNMATHLQYLDSLEEAQKHCTLAQESLMGRRAELEVQAMEAESKGTPDAEKVIAALEKEADDLDTVIADVQNKAEELAQLLAQRLAMKNVLSSAMAMFSNALGGAAGPAGPPHDLATARKLAEQVAVSMGMPAAKVAESLERRAQGEVSGPATAGTAAPAVNLGVVGRGTRRITLQPVQANASVATSQQQDKSLSKGSSQKRRLEDLMGPPPSGGFSAASTTSSFLSAQENGDPALKEARTGA